MKKKQQKTDKKEHFWYRQTHSVTGRLLLLVLSAIGCGLAVYLLLHMFNSWVIDRTVLDTDLRDKLEAHTLGEFEEYIQENNLSATDYAALNSWTGERAEVSITIYRDGKLLYDSTYGSENASDFLGVDEPDYDADTAHHLSFADGEADVVIADYSYVRLYDYAIILDVVFACLVAVIIIVWNIHRTAVYLVELNHEIQEMRAGDLEHPITVRGHDEIAMLARSMDEFRGEIAEKIETIENLEKTNSEMVAEVSHDLRTPLTALMMYLQFARDSMADAAKSGAVSGSETSAPPVQDPMKAEKDRQDGQSEVSSIEFMDMAYDRAVYIRQMLEDTFTYFRPHDEVKKDLSEIFFPEGLYDPLSDMAAFLNGIGMTLLLKDRFPEVRILGYYDSIRRVITNLCSNISKYADAGTPVEVWFDRTRDYVSVRITNKIQEGEHPRGTGLGTKIVDKLMREMEGKYYAKKENGMYETILKFRIVEREKA